MEYKVVVVDAARMPEGHDWAIVEVGDETMFFVAKGVRRADDPDAMAEGWAAFRKLARVPAPRQRVRVA